MLTHKVIVCYAGWSQIGNTSFPEGNVIYLTYKDGILFSSVTIEKLSGHKIEDLFPECEIIMPKS